MSIGVTMFCTFWSFELTAREKFPTWLWLVRNHVNANGVCMYDIYWVDLKLYDTTFIFVFFGFVNVNFGKWRGQGKCVKLSSFGETFLCIRWKMPMKCYMQKDMFVFIIQVSNFIAFRVGFNFKYFVRRVPINAILPLPIHRGVMLNV